MSIVIGRKPGGSGGGGGAPSGPAGGDLGGTYPNPTVVTVQTDAVDTGGIQDGAVTDNKIDSEAATDGQVLTADGAGAAAWLAPPGFELNYAEITSDVTVSGTSAAAPTDVVSLAARVYDGATPIIVEFFAPLVQVGSGATTFVIVCLFDGASEVGRLATFKNAAAGATIQSPVLVRTRLTPSAASHTYNIKAFRLVANGLIAAGTGAADDDLPAYVRATVV